MTTTNWKKSLTVSACISSCSRQQDTASNCSLGAGQQHTLVLCLEVCDATREMSQSKANPWLIQFWRTSMVNSQPSKGYILATQKSVLVEQCLFGKSSQRWPRHCINLTLRLTPASLRSCVAESELSRSVHFSKSSKAPFCHVRVGQHY